jgi:hypothetical protein
VARVVRELRDRHLAACDSSEIKPLRCTPPSVSSWINRLAVALPGALNSLSPDEDLQKFAKI